MVIGGCATRTVLESPYIVIARKLAIMCGIHMSMCLFQICCFDH